MNVCMYVCMYYLISLLLVTLIKAVVLSDKCPASVTNCFDLKF